MLQKGDKAPLTTTFVDEKEAETQLKNYLGSWVVLYFYPRDNTPGCTVEAEGFRDLQKAFTGLNAVVLGVSKDTCKSHKKFIDGKKLNFSLVADEDATLMKAFGIWGEKKFMGRTFMGTSRSTFLIDPNGVVAEVWEKVKPANHPQEVLTHLKILIK